MRKATGLSVLGLGLLAVIPPTEATTVKWQSYDPAVLGQARQEGRRVLLDFYADWCIPCRELDRFTFSDARVIEATKALVMVKVDLTESGSPEVEELRRQFGVTGVPELVFLDEQGNEIKEARVIGYLGPDDFLSHLKRAFKGNL